jgi:Trk K+ transport system NAD-binding subunit
MSDADRQPRRFVVVGLGRVGRRVVTLLRMLGAEVVAITARTRDDWLEDAEAAGATVLLGDGRDGRLLAKAGVAQADALVVATDGDLVNLEIALDARRIRDDLPIVARVFDQTLARHVETTLGLRRAIGVSDVAAPVFAAAALGERVAGAVVLEGVPMVLRIAASGEPVMEPRESWTRRLGHEAPAPERPPGRLAEVADLVRRAFGNAPRGLRAIGLVLLGLVLLSVAVFHYGLRLSVVDAIYFVVTTVTTTGYGDISARGAGVAVQIYACVLMLLGSASTAVLYSFVTDFLVAERVEGLLGRRRIPTRDHVIVAGMGDVGHRICAELAQSGVPFLVVDRSADAEHADAARAGGAFLAGDARTAAVLEEAGVRKARAILAVSGDDAVNLGIALEARALNPAIRTVVRMFDPELARKVERGMGIDAVISSSAIAAPSFVATALYPDAFAATALDDELIVLREIRVTAAMAKKTAGKAAAAEGGKATLYAPPGGTFAAATSSERLEAGGRLVVTVRRRWTAAGSSAQGAAE